VEVVGCDVIVWLKNFVLGVQISCFRVVDGGFEDFFVVFVGCNVVEV